MKHLGFALIVIGLISLFIQNMFYGYVDSAGILHDSIFLPLGVFAIITGVVILVIKLISSFIENNNTK